MSNIYGRRGYVGSSLYLFLSCILLTASEFYLSSLRRGLSCIGFVLGGFGFLLCTIGTFLGFVYNFIFGNGKDKGKVANSLNKKSSNNPGLYKTLMILFFVFAGAGLVLGVVGSIIGFSNF